MVGFGYAVAGFGSSFLVGSPRDNTSGGGAGIVYQYSATNGTLEHTFYTPDPSATGFGQDLYAVGNNFLTTTGTTTAKAYLINGSTGTVIQTFSDARIGPSSAFATFGSNVVIGSPDANGTQYANVYSLNTGSLIRTLQDPVGGSSDRFGSNIVANANYIAVSANQTTVNGNLFAGSVYLYSTATGQLLNTLTPPNSASDSYFGGGLALSGNDLLVGSFGTYSSTGPSYPGVVYRYNISTGALEATYQNPVPHTNDEMGAPLAYDGTNILAALPVKQNPDGGQGDVYLLDGTTGSLLASFQNPLATTNFGGVIALSGTNLAVPDPSVDTGGGAVYVFSTAVPEPSSAGLLALLSIGLLMRRRANPCG